MTDEQYKRLLQSQKWRLTKSPLYKIKTKNLDSSITGSGSAVTFVPNLVQRHFFKHKKNRNLIVKARQLGLSTGQIVYNCDKTLFTKNYNALFIAHEREAAIELFDEKVMFLWNNFPLKYLYEIDTERANKLKVGFRDGTNGNSKSFSSISVALSGRSGTFNTVHISELAKMSVKYPARAKEIITGTIPAVPLDGEVTIESTAEGDQGLFSDMYQEIIKRPKDRDRRLTEFELFFYNWQWDVSEIQKIKNPDPDIPHDFLDYQRKHNELAASNKALVPMSDIHLTYYYYKWLSLNSNWKALWQEYPTVPEEAFVSSGSPLFPLEAVNRQYMYAQSDKISPQTEGDWVMYKQPQSTHTYIIGADPSEGVGNDSSAAVVLDISTPDHVPEVVAEFCNSHTDPILFAHELKRMGRIYNSATIAVERNNHGHAVLVELVRIYPEDMIFKQVRNDEYDVEETPKLGWLTTRPTKAEIIYGLIDAIRDNAIRIFSESVINECKTFQREALTYTKATDKQSRHWDRVMALAIALKVSDYVDDASNVVYTVSRKTQQNIHAAL